MDEAYYTSGDYYQSQEYREIVAHAEAQMWHDFFGGVIFVVMFILAIVVNQRLNQS